MDSEQLILNQTNVSIALANHLLSNEFPNSNVDDLNALSSELVSLVMADGSPSGGPRLAFVNGVWVEKTISLKRSFKRVVKNAYKAEYKQVDFQTKPADKVVKRVNSWAKKHTNGLIKKVLGRDAIDHLTRVIFANAIYFKGMWNEKFDQSKTKDYDFHLLDGTKVQVPFMTTKKKQLVRLCEGFKVLGLPYLEGEDTSRSFTMYIFLPHAKDGLQSLIHKMGTEPNFLDRYMPYQEVKVRKFLIPRFKISFGFEASDMLKELGLVLPFAAEEGLTEMVEGEKVCVSSIFHKSFLEVNEEGTEAAAVSVTDVYLLASPSRVEFKVDFVADHPFLFVIREDVSEAVLFMGQVVDPHVA